MLALRWGTVSALAVILLLILSIPDKVRQPGAAMASAQESQKEEKRVYTNDDWPFNRPRAAERSEEKAEDAAPVALSPSQRQQRVAPFVPTPMEIVDKMLEIAQVTPQDVVYDLGSGDGRIVIHAAEKYGAKAVGVELDPNLVRESREKAKDRGVEERATFIQGDLMQTPFNDATVVAVYLMLEANDKLRPLLEKDLRPGARVVVHDIRIPGWNPSEEETVTIGNGDHYVYLYRVPDAFRR